MSPRGSQRKGAAGERDVAALLSALFGVEVKRASGPYLPGLLAPDVFGLPGVHLEVKRVARLNLCAALRQSRRDAAGKVPMVLHRRNREGWVASVPLEDLPALVRALADNHLPAHAGAAPTGSSAMNGTIKP